MAKKYIGLWQVLNIIERAQKKEQKRYGITAAFYLLNSLKSYIKKLPAANVQEVKHGAWIYEEGIYQVCSVCDYHPILSEFLASYNVRLNTNYCPNCGAIMDGDKK